jgi:hypothetical protein
MIFQEPNFSIGRATRSMSFTSSLAPGLAFLQLHLRGSASAVTQCFITSKPLSVVILTTLGRTQCGPANSWLAEWFFSTSLSVAASISCLLCGSYVGRSKTKGVSSVSAPARDTVSVSSQRSAKLDTQNDGVSVVLLGEFISHLSHASAAQHRGEP